MTLFERYCLAVGWMVTWRDRALRAWSIVWPVFVWALVIFGSYVSWRSFGEGC